MEIIKIKKDNIKLSDIKIFVCAPGLGKTYLDGIDENYMDIDRLRSNFKYGKSDEYTISQHELNKGLSCRKTVKTTSEILEYSINLILNNIKNDVISLIAPNDDIVEKLNELKIPYAIVFIDPGIVNLVIDRLKSRGNNQKFINEMYGDIERKEYYKKDMQDNRPNYKIIFNKDEYISDIRDKLLI